ncbi:MAG: post-transcriptional regulator [Vagococcus sp.]|uniref:post-transcriptional regulator n=1 Tax=Vagococcus sp. TaxID=1933889 RepID=UPI002FCC61E9
MISKTKKWRLNPIIKECVVTFSKNGYQEISEEDIWRYILDYRWQKKCPETFQEMKKDLKKLSANDFFDYQQLKAMQKDKFEELNFLL